MTEDKLYMPEPRPLTYSTVVFERITGEPNEKWGHKRGDLLHWTYKSLTHDQARQRVVTKLKRQGENPLNWKEVK